MNKISFIFILTFSLFLLSCSSDDDNTVDLPNLGSVAIALSGDIEGNRTGVADFSFLDLGSMQTWELSFNDFGPQTFSLNLMLTDLESVLRPAPGTYEIGFDALDPNVFFGDFTDIPNGDFLGAVEYDTFEKGGTLTIETSTDEKVTGHFEFAADSRDDDFEIIGTVFITGNFEALNRRSL